MKTEHLDYFIEVVNSGSFNKVAEEHFTSHQAIKNAMKNLENELQVKLLQSNNQGTTITTEGEILLQYAQQIHVLTELLRNELSPFVQANPSKKQLLEIYLTPYLTDGSLLDFVEAYQKQEREIKVQLRSLPVESVYEYLVGSSAILIVPTVEEAMQEESFRQILKKYNLTYSVLAERELYVCTHKKSKWAAKSFLGKHDMAQLPMLVSSGSSLNMNLMKNREKQQVVTSITTQKNMIKKGIGVSLMTELEFAYYYKGENSFVLIPCELEPVTYVCLHQKDVALPGYVETFLEKLKDIF